jgi:hypothetical protein
LGSARPIAHLALLGDQGEKVDIWIIMNMIRLRGRRITKRGEVAPVWDSGFRTSR